MAEGHGRAAWGHTSSLLAMLANIHRDTRKRRRPYQPGEFNPHSQARRRRGSPVSVTRLTEEVMRISESRQKQRGIR